MKALSIINGVVDEQVHGDIERYAQLLGFLSYEPEGALDGDPVIVLSFHKSRRNKGIALGRYRL